MSVTIYFLGSFERGATCPYVQNAPDLKFVRVVSVSKQVVAGLLWNLTVEVETPVGPAEYKATVYEPPGPDSKRYRVSHILRFKLMSMRHVKRGLGSGLGSACCENDSVGGGSAEYRVRPMPAPHSTVFTPPCFKFVS
jgi:hypothetical protein